MITYKGFKAIYLGVGRWKVIIGDWDFSILCKDGIRELISNIDRWEDQI